MNIRAMVRRLSVTAERLVYNARTYSWLLDFWMPAYRERMMPINRPVFLLGVQGGGLTLLSRMLRRNPNAVSAAGGSKYWTSSDEIQNVFGLYLPAPLTGLRYKAPYHPVLSAPRGWTYATRELLGHYRNTEEDADIHLKDSLERVIRYCVRRYARSPSVSRFIDKSQVYTVKFGLIHELLKEHEPKFVLVPRDPYVSVYRAATGKPKDMRRLQSILSYEQRIRYCAEHYMNSMRLALDDCDRLGCGVHIVQFERLVAEPERELRAVCEFIGMEFDEDMLPSPGQKLPFGSRFRDRWYPIRADINDQYAEKIDRLTVETVNANGIGVIEKLGYPVRDATQCAR